MYSRGTRTNGRQDREGVIGRKDGEILMTRTVNLGDILDLIGRTVVGCCG